MRSYRTVINGKVYCRTSQRSSVGCPRITIPNI